MHKWAVWTRTLAAAVVGACRRIAGFAFGKTIAFTYAVIVSVVANVVFDFVRNPPHPGSMDPVAVASDKHVADTAARAPLPASPPATMVTIVPIENAEPVASSHSENSRPGPGSGGLY